MEYSANKAHVCLILIVFFDCSTEIFQPVIP